MLRVMLLASACSIAGASTATSSEALSSDALRSAVVGKTVHVDTPIGVVPISFRSDGTMQGSSSGLAAYALSTSDRGRWWVSGDRLCQRWEAWFDRQTKCFAMQREGQTLHWRSNDGRQGTARVSR